MSDMSVQSLFSVKGKVALVTGGSRGIGEMIAAGLLANGAKVYISSRKAQACDEAAERLMKNYGGECIPLPANVAEIDGIEDQYSLSTANSEKLLDEDAFLFLHEDDTFIINEADVVVAAEISADNEEIGQKIIDDDILDFSEQNPFSLTRTF